MTSLCSNLAVLLLFLNASNLLHPRLFTHAASSSPPVTRHRINVLVDDYEESETQSVSPDVIQPVKTTVLKRVTQPCQYDPCSQTQKPCHDLSAETGCLCPGISRADEPPHAPRINGLQPVSTGVNRGKIEVRWCAPSSVVSRYRVVVEGSEEEAVEFASNSRNGFVGSLEVGTKVCVEAVNKAGHSEPSAFSCKRFDHAESSDDTLSLAWVIGGGVSLLVLVIVVAVIIWRYRRHRNAKRNSADGLGNPSYSTEGTL